MMTKTKRKLYFLAAVFMIFALALGGCGKEETDASGGGSKETEEQVKRGPLAQKLADAAVGDIVTFGVWEQDRDPLNGDEPIEWYVLEKSDSEVTLMSVYLLDGQPYHYQDKKIYNVTWERCSLRTWLNEDFYQSAFNEEEAAMILPTNLTNKNNPFYDDAAGGEDTSDKVWLLSLDEVEKYFGIPMTPETNPYYKRTLGNEEYALYCYQQDSRILAKPTDAAWGRINQFFRMEEKALEYYEAEGYDFSFALGCCGWWLRSPGSEGDEAAFADASGAFDYDGIEVEVKSGVRPVIKVSY